MISMELFDRTLLKLKAEINELNLRMESGEPASRWDKTLTRLEERLELLLTAKDGCLG